MIKVKNLNKSFGDLHVVKDVNLEVEKGDVIAILGPSGSGKTTLLRCINFLERAENGILEFDGISYDLSSIRKKDILELRKKTAFVFQNFNLFLNKTALQNVMEGLVTARKMNPIEAEQIAIRALEKVGMSDRLNHYPGQLSGGQQQRVAIARAIATNPEIIYFDEPTSALDPELISEVLQIMKDLANEGMTMLVVTHEINFARNVSNKVIFMQQGEVIECAKSSDFFEHPKTVRSQQFIQSIMNTHEV